MISFSSLGQVLRARTRLLDARSFAVLLGSCSSWEQLGKGSSQQELSDFERSPHFNKEQQVFENRRPKILEEMNERVDWQLTLEYFTSDSSRRTPDKPLPEVNPPDLQAFLEPTESLRFIWLGHSTLISKCPKQTDPV